MACGPTIKGRATVALLAEGVDRNYYRELGLYAEDPSPSSRRAWIEISSAAFRLKK